MCSGTDVDLDAIWAAGGGEAWVAGKGGTLLHWDGRSWNPVASGTSHGLHAIRGSSTHDVWVVGDSGTFLRWNGIQ